MRHYIRGAKGRFNGSTGGGGGRRGGGGGRSPARANGVVSRRARGGFAHVAGGKGRGAVTVFAQRSRTGKVRSMATINTGRNARGRAVLLRPGVGSKPPRAPFQKGHTRRGLIVVRHGGQSRVSRTYVQKIRMPKHLASGTRVQRTAYVLSPRR